MASVNRSVKRWIRTTQRNQIRKSLGILLTLALTAHSFSWAESQPSGIQAQVKKLAGQKAKVTLTDGTLEKGKIGAVDVQSFVLDRGSKKGTSTISYTSVKTIQRDGLSTGAQIAIVGGVVVILAVGIAELVEVSRVPHGNIGSLCPPGNPQCL